MVPFPAVPTLLNPSLYLATHLTVIYCTVSVPGSRHSPLSLVRTSSYSIYGPTALPMTEWHRDFYPQLQSVAVECVQEAGEMLYVVSVPR